MRETQHQMQVLLLLKGTADLAESLYEATSEFGCPYPNHTRRNIAEAIGVARKLIDDTVGPNPFYIDHRPQSRWPFDTEGKVKP